MTIDERLEALAVRHGALAQSVKLLTQMQNWRSSAWGSLPVSSWLRAAPVEVAPLPWPKQDTAASYHDVLGTVSVDIAPTIGPSLRLGKQ
jgi:hypothetical protein